MVFIDEIEPNLFHREDYYFAQIAHELRRWKVKSVGKLETFLFKFKKIITKTKTVTDIKREREDRMARSKAAWLQACGILPVTSEEQLQVPRE